MYTERSKKRMEAKGEIERFALNQLVNKLNNSKKHYYKLLATQTSKSISYDGQIFVFDKVSDTLLEKYLVEVKVRTESYDEYFLERKKLQSLRKQEKQISCKCGVGRFKKLYVNFTPNGVYMFDLDQMEQDNLLNQPILREMNEVTVESTSKKVKKLVYLLNVKDAIKHINMTISGEEIINYFKHNIDIANEGIKMTEERIKKIVDFITDAN